MTTGLDLVRLQIEIANGQKLSLGQGDIRPRGHALECRIYAEDPEKDFFPSPGTIRFVKEPGGPGIRIDSGIYQGFEVPVDYDPILAKLIVHAGTRDQATAKMIKALQEYIILGVKTPMEFMTDVLNSRPFREGRVFTDFIPAHFSDWKPDRDLADVAMMAFLAHGQGKAGKQKASLGPEKALSPWDTLGNWKL
jgi:acetyl-CoA carboxylase biotin carboxylase subunit